MDEQGGTARPRVRALSAVLVAALALVGVAVFGVAPALAQTVPPPSASLTTDPPTLRTGRPVTLVATVNNPAPGFLPGFARFVHSGGDGSLGDVRLDANGQARFTLIPFDTDYSVFVFSDGAFGPLFSPALFVDVIPGFTVDLGFTTVPAHAGPGDDVLVRVTVTGGPSLPDEAEGDSTPSGQVTVKSGTTSLGTGVLNHGGKVDIPVRLPGGGGEAAPREGGVPLTVSYAGDDLFVDSASAPFVVSPPVDQPPPATVPPASDPGTTPAADGGSTSTLFGPPTPTTVPLTAEEPAEDGPTVDADSTDTGGDEPAFEEAAAPAATTAGDGQDTGLQRSAFILGIPSPVSLDWSGAHVVVNLLLALLLMILTGIPSALIDKTIEENHDRIVASFVGEQASIRRVERWLQALPDPVLLAALSVIAAVVFTELDPSSGFDVTTGVLVLALALVVALVVGVHDLGRLPFLNRRWGRPAAAFGLYPFSLILAVVLVVVSRVAGFSPGFVFGVIGTLALKETVTKRDEAVSLTGAGIGLLVVAVGAWWLWHPIVDQVTGADPSASIIFLDAFLASLWLMCIQAVAFGFAPLSYFDGGRVREWSTPAWLLIQGTGMFLLVQFYLHPSAGRWGALDGTSMRQALSVFVVFLVGAILFWSWFRFRPAPPSDVATTGAEPRQSRSG